MDLLTVWSKSLNWETKNPARLIRTLGLVVQLAIVVMETHSFVSKMRGTIANQRLAATFAQIYASKRVGKRSGKRVKGKGNWKDRE